MTKYINLHNMVFNQPHLCTPEYAETVLAVLSEKLNIQEGLFQIQNEPKEKRDIEVNANGIYTLPIVGSMVHRGGMMDAMSGTMSYEGIQSNIQSALDNPNVKGILLDVDSSGGAVAGAFDLRDFIMEAKKQKPIYALARDSMCSAAYLISSACTKVYATQTAAVGSIGVVAMHVDKSKVNEEAGVKPTFIYAGKFKTAGNANEPLQGEALDYLQESVNDSYDMFVKAVAEARGLGEQAIRDTEARVYKGQKAKSLGLVDGVRAMKTVYKELADVSQKRVITQTMSNKGLKMDNEVDVEKLAADLTQALADVESTKAQMEGLQAAIVAEGYTITEEGISKEAAEEFMDINGEKVAKSAIPAPVLKALELAEFEKAEAAIQKRCAEVLPNVKEANARVLLKAADTADEDFLGFLKAVDALFDSKMEEVGKTDAETSFDSASDKLDAMIKGYSKEHGVAVHKATAEVLKTAEGRTLQKEAMKERK